jgi:CheY-like chemotaxis protein
MQTTQAGNEAPPAVGVSARQPRVLVVDDEDMVRTVLKAVLRYGGYAVTEAVDGEDAVQQYARTSPSFDLVLLDLHMPRLNGYDALARIRNLEPNAKAVFLSGGARDAEEQTIRHLAGVAFLHKPFENRELLRLVGEMLGRVSSTNR